MSSPVVCIAQVEHSIETEREVRIYSRSESTANTQTEAIHFEGNRNLVANYFLYFYLFNRLLDAVGFVGIICPHVTKKLMGQDHRVTIPVSALSGSLLLLLADTLSRSVGGGSALPVGAITSLLGAPFFLAVIFSGKENR